MQGIYTISPFYFVNPTKKRTHFFHIWAQIRFLFNDHNILVFHEINMPQVTKPVWQIQVKSTLLEDTLLFRIAVFRNHTTAFSSVHMWKRKRSHQNNSLPLFPTFIRPSIIHSKSWKNTLQHFPNKTPRWHSQTTTQTSECFYALWLTPKSAPLIQNTNLGIHHKKYTIKS